jgi:hypothetical protein
VRKTASTAPRKSVENMAIPNSVVPAKSVVSTSPPFLKVVEPSLILASATATASP